MMANPDYYDLNKLRSLVEKPKGKAPVNPNTAVFKKLEAKKPKKQKNKSR
jgi:hypothetical protein